MKILKSLSSSIIALILLLSVSTVHGATITVTEMNDSFGANLCSLRDAVEYINSVGTAPNTGCSPTGDPIGMNDTIILQAGQYNLTLSGIDDNNMAGDLDVEAPEITIMGAGSDQTTIDASGLMERDRVIHFLQGLSQTATVRGVRMTGGDTSVIVEFGGAIWAGTQVLNLDDVHLFMNKSVGGGGLFAVCEANVNNSTIELNQAVQGQQANDGGGGILLNFGPGNCNEHLLNVTNSWIIDNMSEQRGGGIKIDIDTGLRVFNSTVDGNEAFACGGGISTGVNSTAAISYSTISRNNTLDSIGGGICDEAEYLFLTNSTVSTNTSVIAGGGIQSQGGLKGLYNVTVTLNQVTGQGGFGGGVQRNGNLQDDRFDIQVYNTIIAQNTADNRPDCEGTFGSGGYNLIGNDGSGDPGQCNIFNATGDKVGTPGNPIDAQLEPLDFYGGTTETHALVTTSPAVDMGNPADCLALDTANFFATDNINFMDLNDDQRFFTRPIAILDPNTPICDIGAFELQVFDFQLTKDDGLNGASVEVGDNYTYTITLTNIGPGDAANVMLNDPLPAQVSFVSLTTSQGTCNQAGGVVSCDLGDIPPGGVVTVTVTVTANIEGDAVNVVTVTTSVGDFVATETTPIVAPVASICVTGSGHFWDTIRPGCGNCSLNPYAGPVKGALSWTLLASLAALGYVGLRRRARMHRV